MTRAAASCLRPPSPVRLPDNQWPPRGSETNRRLVFGACSSMRDAPGSHREAVVISGTWPHERTGYGIAVQASLREYGKFFSRVHFFGPGGEPFDGRSQWDGMPIDWYGLPVIAGAKWWRFLRSVGTGVPAITVRFRPAAGEFLRRTDDILNQARRRDTEVVAIYEDVPAACYLPLLRQRHPRVLQGLRSHNCMVKGFAGLDQQGSLVSRLAWRVELARIRRFEHDVCSSADAFWVISSQEAAEYRTRLGLEPHGILGVSLDADRYSRVPPGDPATVVHVGSADLRKGAGLRRFLAQGWPRVRAQIPQAKLVLGGHGTDGLADPPQGVQGMGFVSDDREILARGQLFLNPQQIGAGIKLKSITAMLAGKALVSTPTGIEGVEGREGRHFFVAETAEALADQIVALIRSPAQVHAAAREARALAAARYSQSSLSAVVQPLLKAFVSQAQDRHEVHG